RLGRSGRAGPARRAGRGARPGRRGARVAQVRGAGRGAVLAAERRLRGLRADPVRLPTDRGGTARRAGTLLPDPGADGADPRGPDRHGGLREPGATADVGMTDAPERTAEEDGVVTEREDAAGHGPEHEAAA